MFQKAWELLLKRLEGRTVWSKAELQQAMLECLVEAGKDMNFIPSAYDTIPDIREMAYV